MNPVTLCLTDYCSPLSSAPLFPPKPPNLPKPLHHNHSPITILSQFGPPLERTSVSRRDLFLLISLGSFLPSSPASAFNVGISGPKDWLKEQKKKTSKYLLAPIDASREILRSAFLLLTGKDSDYESKDLEDVQNMFKTAARDCVPEDRNSFVEFQAKTGVEVDTIQACGGQKTNDGKRFRSGGGVLWNILKTREPIAYREIMKKGREFEIEPIPSGNLPPGFDPTQCRSIYVGNIHPQVTEPLLQEVFSCTGIVESCKLVRKEKVPYAS